MGNIGVRQRSPRSGTFVDEAIRPDILIVVEHPPVVVAAPKWLATTRAPKRRSFHKVSFSMRAGESITRERVSGIPHSVQ